MIYKNTKIEKLTNKCTAEAYKAYIHAEQNLEGLRVKTECSIRILHVFTKKNAK